MDATHVNTDDAPLSTSKHASTADVATRELIEPRGDSVTTAVVTINRPRRALYDYFRDFSNLATFMDNVERVDVRDASVSHWVVKAPGGSTVEWDARITAEQPGQLVAWASVEGADVPNSGRVEFADAGSRGTVVTAILSYDPPGGAIGKIVAKLCQREPSIQARRDLRRFKQLMEAGEIATSSRTREQLAQEKE